MIRSFILLLAFLLAAAPTTRADEPENWPTYPPRQALSNGDHAPPAGEPEKKPTEREIKALIDKLVSPNLKPITYDEDRTFGTGVHLPPGFEAAKQLGINQARTDLIKAGIATFPFLIDRLDDDRYSLTCVNALSSWYKNQSVGGVCRGILSGHVQPYGCFQETSGRRPTARRPTYPEAFLSSKDAAKNWLEKRKDKPLGQLQLEVLDWVIAEEAKQPSKYSDEERSHLREIRKNLEGGQKPLPFNDCYMNHYLNSYSSGMPM